MDFIVKLPPSIDPVIKIIYDLIVVIVDKLTKYAIIILFKETYSVSELGWVILDRLIRDYGIPKLVTLDRDKLFTSNY
jgi:hypothetical protein